MKNFHTGQTAKEANNAIKSSLKTMENAKQCAVLWFEEILKRKLYRDLGYSTINQYAKLELGFSKSRTGDFLQLCRAFSELPEVRAKVESGDLGYTAARALIKVATRENEKDWLNYAENNPRRELEKEVKRAQQDAADDAVGQASLLPAEPKKRPAAVVPVNINLKMTPTQFARYEALWEQIRKQRKAPADKVEALLEVMGSYAAKRSPRGDLQATNKPPVQLHIHQCPECEKATIQTSKGEMEISETELERAQCDCQVSRPNDRNTTSIPPATRRLVLTRARGKCQRPGCDHAHYLEIHHKTPRSQGGTNDPENLICYCSSCHQLVHEKHLGWVKSPQMIYKWKTGTLFPTNLSIFRKQDHPQLIYTPAELNPGSPHDRFETAR